MELVELEGLAHSIVGKPGLSGLSVEQRKRLTIAVELVANPSIIFMVRPSAPCLSIAERCCMHLWQALRHAVQPRVRHGTPMQHDEGPRKGRILRLTWLDTSLLGEGCCLFRP